jgi:hypothetical protein
MAGEGARMSAVIPVAASMSAVSVAEADISVAMVRNAVGASISAGIAAGAGISRRRAGTRGPQSRAGLATVRVGRISAGAAGSLRRSCADRATGTRRARCGECEP